MSTILSFRDIENKHEVYRGKNCMKKNCESLREHTTVWDQCHFIGDCRGILYLKKFL